MNIADRRGFAITADATYEQILEEMLARYRELAGFSPDLASDASIRLRVLASQIFTLNQRVNELEKQGFAGTATGDYLERHAAARGITRKGAAASSGILRFSRQTASPEEIQLPAGLICASAGEPSVRYLTRLPVTLAAGALSVDVPALSAESGAHTNAAPGSVRIMITPAPSLTSVTNPAAFEGGADAETDSQLRGRLLHQYRMISNSTNTAYYYDLAMSREGVRSCRVTGKKRGVGTVDVVVEAEEAEILALREQLNLAKEINVDVLVKQAAVKAVDCALELAPQPGADFDRLQSEVRQALTDYIASLGVGAPLLTARFAAKLLEIPGLYNIRLLAPLDDVACTAEQILSCGAVTLTRAGTEPGRVSD